MQDLEQDQRELQGFSVVKRFMFPWLAPFPSIVLLPWADRKRSGRTGGKKQDRLLFMLGSKRPILPGQFQK